MTSPETDEESAGRRAYEQTLYKHAVEGEKRFWSKNELRTRPGLIEDGCPPNATRTNIPRSLTFDPMQKRCYRSGARARHHKTDEQN